MVGDNIDAIKHLLKSYSNEVDCIYIDPPYNTGKKDFVYPDTFEFTKESLAKSAGIEEDEAERILNMAGKSTFLRQNADLLWKVYQRAATKLLELPKIKPQIRQNSRYFAAG